jgi:ribosome-associated protein
MRNPDLNKPIANRQFEKEYSFVLTDSTLPEEQSSENPATKVKLVFHVKDSCLLSDKEKEIVLIQLKRRINDEGYLQVFADEYREQKRNKQMAEKRFYNYLNSVLKKKKNSISTKHTEKKTKKRNLPSGKAGKRRRKTSLHKINYNPAT